MTTVSSHNMKTALQSGVNRKLIEQFEWPPFTPEYGKYRSILKDAVPPNFIPELFFVRFNDLRSEEVSQWLKRQLSPADGNPDRDNTPLLRGLSRLLEVDPEVVARVSPELAAIFRDVDPARAGFSFDREGLIGLLKKFDQKDEASRDAIIGFILKLEPEAMSHLFAGWSAAITYGMDPSGPEFDRLPQFLQKVVPNADQDYMTRGLLVDVHTILSTFDSEEDIQEWGRKYQRGEGHDRVPLLTLYSGNTHTILVTFACDIRSTLETAKTLALLGPTEEEYAQLAQDTSPDRFARIRKGVAERWPRASAAASWWSESVKLSRHFTAAELVRTTDQAPASPLTSFDQISFSSLYGSRS